MVISTTAEALKQALRAQEAIEKHKRKVLSQYWYYTGNLADALGLSVMLQGRN